MTIMAFGVLELIIILALSGGAVPLGIPPAADDPVLSQMVPEKCLYYSSWNGMTDADANSSNHVEQLLSEPQVKELIQYIETTLGSQLAAQANAIPDPTMRRAAQRAPDVIIGLLTNATAMFVTDVQLAAGQPPQVQAGWATNISDFRADAEFMLNLVRDVRGLQMRATTIEGTSFWQVQPAPEAPLFTFGIWKDYLLVGVGEGTIAKMLDWAKTPAPQWHQELTSSFPGRRATASYLNLARIRELIAEQAPPQVQAVLQASGLGQADAIEATTGLTDSDFLSQTRLRLNGEPQGVWQAIGSSPLEVDDIKNIPADALLALVLRMDLGQLIDEVFNVAEKIDPRASQELREGMRQAESQLGFRIREDLLAALGDVWQVYGAPSTGGYLAGWTATVSLDDRAALTRVQDALLSVVYQLRSREDAPFAIRQTVHHGQTIQYLAFEEPVPFSPAWCITDTHLVIGVLPQTVKAFLDGSNQPPLIDIPGIKASFENGAPFALQYVDSKTAFETTYPYLQMLAMMGAGELRKQGIDLDTTKLPGAEVIARHIQPAHTTLIRDKDGFLLTSRQTVPTISVGASTPVAVALLLPAVQAAREAARRASSSNNLKQIGLACHNFHDVYRFFPPAYNLSEDGKPLLSWRVHILPFVEEQNLYEEFHLDEPWDSEHNRQLISRMPRIYASPNSTQIGSGKTVYLALQQPGAIMEAPKPEQRRDGYTMGTKISAVRDGTSNTAMVVEANNDAAVTWTKPDDLEVNWDNPFAELIGMRPAVFLALFADGSVRPISFSIDPQTFKALVTKDGGERVPSNY